VHGSACFFVYTLRRHLSVVTTSFRHAFGTPHVCEMAVSAPPCVWRAGHVLGSTCVLINAAPFNALDSMPCRVARHAIEVLCRFARACLSSLLLCPPPLTHSPTRSLARSIHALARSFDSAWSGPLKSKRFREKIASATIRDMSDDSNEWCVELLITFL
jgi:hypothetical protein